MVDVLFNFFFDLGFYYCFDLIFFIFYEFFDEVYNFKSYFGFIDFGCYVFV